MSSMMFCKVAIFSLLIASAYSQIKLDELIANAFANATAQAVTDIDAVLTITETDPTTVAAATSTLNECGYRRGNSAEYSETEAVFGEFPWMVAIKRLEEIIPNLSTAIYICGGALIHPSVVITAAHCVQAYANDKLLVRVGVFKQNDSNAELPLAQRRLKSSHLHPAYNSRNGRNDVALLVLDSPIEMQQHIGTVCMPDAKVSLDNKRCLMTGWGKDQYTNSTYARNLKKIELPIVPSPKCQETLRSTYLGEYYTLDASFLCAGGEEGKDACNGDGGSPLVCPVSGSENRYYLAGLVSWGIQCGEKDIPGVYSNVVTQRDWILATLEREGFANEIQTT